MKIWRARLVALVTVVAGFTALPAAAQNLLINGSFEGGIGGWTTVGGQCTPSSQTAGNPAIGAGGGTPPPPGQFIAPAAIDGTHVYMGDTLAPGVCLFFQDVTLPAGQTQGYLTFSAGYNFRDFGGGAGGCEADISITDTANAPIAPPGYVQVASAVDDPLTHRAPIVFSTTPGATVRVLITETSCAGGPVGLVLDGLALSPGAPPVPTLGEWSMAILALLLGIGAALHFRARA
jgi:hypothetical protein